MCTECACHVVTKLRSSAFAFRHAFRRNTPSRVSTRGVMAGQNTRRKRVTMAPRAGFLAKLVEPAFQWAAVRYKAAVGAELKKYGLRYDDLLDPTMNFDVKEALRRCSPKEKDDRNARLKRAMDLSMKHAYLSKELQEQQTPFKQYITPHLVEVEAEQNERLHLGAAVPYQRAIP